MEDKICCKKSKNLKTFNMSLHSLFPTCEWLIFRKFAFGRYDVISNIKNEYTILDADSWCMDVNNNFIKCAVDSKNSIYIFFKVGSRAISIRDGAERMYMDLTRIIDYDASYCSSDTGLKLTQFTIELIQLLCIEGMKLKGPPMRINTNKNLIYFELTKNNKYNEIWTTILHEVLRAITKESCISFSSLINKTTPISKKYNTLKNIKINNN